MYTLVDCLVSVALRPLFFFLISVGTSLLFALLRNTGRLKEVQLE